MPRFVLKLFMLLSSAAAIAVLLWFPAVSVFRSPAIAQEPAQLSDEAHRSSSSSSSSSYARLRLSSSPNDSATGNQNQPDEISNQTTARKKTEINVSHTRNQTLNATNTSGKPDTANKAALTTTEPETSLSGQLLLTDRNDLGYRGNTILETPPTEGGRFLIFECLAEGSLCGGLGDREEGLVTAFLLAYLTKRRFGIRMTTPCDLTQFLQPNRYNWTVPEKEIAGKSTARIYAIDRTPFSAEIPLMDFNAKYPADVVFLQTNRDLLAGIRGNPHYRDALPSWAKQARPHFFRDVFATLMKPSARLRQRLERFLLSAGFWARARPLVGVHVRTGGSKHFSDGQFGDVLSRVGVLWDFVQRYVGNGSDVFVATDNPEVHESASAKFGARCHNTKAVLRHIDRQRDDPDICLAFEGAILDQLILTLCDVLVVFPGSGYSSRAAMIRGTNGQLFEFGPTVNPADMYKMCEPIC